jgi:hypothetical protein
VRAAWEGNFTAHGQVHLHNFHVHEQGATGSERPDLHESGFRAMLFHVSMSYRLNGLGPERLLELPYLKEAASPCSALATLLTALI